LNLTIDIGNTRTKLGIFEDDHLISHYVLEEIDMDVLILKYKIKSCIIATSGKENEAIKTFLNQKNIPFKQIDKTNIPISIDHYKSAETLGQDRILSCIGARSIETNADVMVITAGTCITYNILTAKNDFLGGAISPGLAMRFAAMHQFTDKLPEIKFTNQNPTYIGNTTNTSMESGAIIGAVGEIDNFIRLYQTDFPHIKVFLTGGDAEFLKTKINNKIFADEHLVLKGLNALSRYYE
jgi:type III pantothenate kinase